MPSNEASNSGSKQRSSVRDVHVIWMTGGLSCDGDSVSVTAAMQPSIEDIVLGAIPGLPKVHLHNPVLAYEVGDDFMKHWYLAEEGKLDPFVLVIEGSIPNEAIKREGYWAAQGTNHDTGQPITTCEWIDRLAPKAVGGGGCRDLRNLWRHSRHARQSDGLHGLGRLLGLEVEIQSWPAHCERSGLPRAAG